MSNLEKNKIYTFPFTAIRGQEEMSLALILNVIDPRIGGVMIMGDRGTGKSTAVRALVDLLPNIKIIKNDPYNTEPSSPNDENIITIATPMVDLPLGATEDRVCGTINTKKAIIGEKVFEPGLLAKANRGILYIDEINLLDDHLVDLLLDAAASGWNTVERETISNKHPSRFILVGSGNPEEGELRPQLLDRFGMYAEAKTVSDAYERLIIVTQRIKFDLEPETIIKTFEKEQEKQRNIIRQAKDLLPNVMVLTPLKILISALCAELKIDGLRGDLVCTRAAKALAAMEGRTLVKPSDIQRIINLCLRHRLRKDPLETIDSGIKIQSLYKNIYETVNQTNKPSLDDIENEKLDLNINDSYKVSL